MQLIKRSITPDRKKAIPFVIFILIMIGGLVQRAPIFESPPQAVPSPLGDFSLTLMWLLLSFPFVVLPIGLSVAGFVNISVFSWLFIAANAVYLYLLSCLLVSSFTRYKHRLSEWHWIIIIGVPFILLAVLPISYLRIPLWFIDDIANYLGVSLIASLYLYLLTCLSFFFHDAIRKNKVSTITGLTPPAAGGYIGVPTGDHPGIGGAGQVDKLKEE